MEEVSAERVRIARELHDGIAQDIASIGFRIDVLIGNTNVDSSLRTQLRLIRHSITAAGELLRDEIHELRDLPGRSFEEIVDDLAENFLRTHAIEYQLTVNGEPEVDSRFHLQRVVQEIFYNIAQHSQSSRVSIVVTEKSIDISDNGIGMSVVEQRRWGLVGISERMNEISGRLDITNVNPGTRFHLSW